ncbi:MAG: B12-binding domain-containing radical SAM protein [Deltaproteobacteria bacterium]|nr:B12-binding domain-containing radical SAM protein [Deltaproteobacteria bacterium]
MSKPFLLFVNPWIYDFAAYDLWAKPLGLLHLAGRARKWGFRVDVWDGMASFHPALRARTPVRRQFGTGKYYRQAVSKPEPLKHTPRPYFRYGLSAEILRQDLLGLRSKSPDVVIVTSLMTYWYPGVFEAIRTIRNVFPKTPILLGGIYATLCTEHARKYSEADEVIPGPGEPSVSEGNNAEEEHYPAFDLLASLNYLCVLTSRGCPLGCHYCASNQLYPHFRQRNPETVFREILHGVKRFGVRDVAFYDDALLLNARDCIVPLLRRILDANLKLRLHTPNGLHLKYISSELARMMKQAGFVTVRLGYESPDPEWQTRTGGKAARRHLFNALDNLTSAGFTAQELGVYLMMGLPGQTPSEVEAGIREVGNAAGTPCLAEYSPIPGTKMWEEAKRSARYDIESEPLYHNNSLMPCASVGFSEGKIRELRRLCRAGRVGGRRTPVKGLMQRT